MIKTILYVGFQYEYGNRESDSINNKGFFQTFKKLSYEVTPIWYDDFVPAKAQRHPSELESAILSLAAKIEPDMIFLILQEDQICLETLEKLRGNGHFVVNWFGDDHWRFDSFTSRYAPNLDVCITTDKFSLQKYQDLGQGNVIQSQWASLDSNIEFENVSYNFEVSFVGGASPFRRWFVGELQDRGLKVECFGSGWESGKVSYKQMERIFVSSKINLNISNSIQFDVRYLLANPRNILNTFRNPKNMSQVKARVFEIPAQGGFELTDYVPALEDYFDIGKEIICYGDVDEAAMLAKYYLSNQSEREKIKFAGVKRARLQHTFSHRIGRFMQQVNEYKRKNKTVAIGSDSCS